MKLARGLALHFGLLAAALALALVFWLRNETPDARARQMVEVWSGVPAGVESIAWESEKLTVKLASQRDDTGRYFVGSVEQNVARVKAKKAAADAGADAAPSQQSSTERRRETTRFISAGAADKLVEGLAPLKAYRAIGQVDQSRAEEFGLAKPEGTLRITIAGQPHSLLIGGSTPGGGDHYARHAETGQVYAIPGEIARSLMYAGSRLVERDLHAWEADEASRATISAGDVRRELLRVEGKKNAWANPSTPSQQDETAGNWMSKLGRLRVMKHLEKPRAPQVIVQVDYFSGRRKLGFIELSRVAGSAGKPEYLVRTEYTRWHAKVFRTSAEQVEQDLGSVLR